jgi:hypothetical protein
LLRCRISLAPRLTNMEVEFVSLPASYLGSGAWLRALHLREIGAHPKVVELGDGWSVSARTCERSCCVGERIAQDQMNDRPDTASAPSHAAVFR